MQHERHGLTERRIGFFGKGGSGKSTVLVLLAQTLQRRGYDVCVLDADSTNLGLHRALGLDHAPAPLLDYFGGMVFSGGRVTCPVDDPTPLAGAALSLDQLPAAYYSHTDDGMLFLAAGKIGDRGPGAGCDGPVAKIARDLTLDRDADHPVTLIDFKAGFEDAARGAVTSIDWALVVVDPTLAAIRMARHMQAMVAQLKAGVPPATQHLETPELVAWARRIFRDASVQGASVILNRIKDAEMERFVRAALGEYGIDPIGVIPEDPAIAMSWLRGTRVDAPRTAAATARIVAHLEAVAAAPVPV